MSFARNLVKVHKGQELVWAQMGKEHEQQQQKSGMKGITHLQNAQDSKQSAQLRCYPVSSRAYNKKDYDYLSSFPRVGHSIALKTSIDQHCDVELAREQSDVDSDLSMTTTSVDYANSLSSASSTGSSAQSYSKDAASLTDMESGHQQQGHSHHDRPHQNHLQREPHQQDHDQQHCKHLHPNDQSETSTLSARNVSEKAELQTVKDSSSDSNSEAKDNKLDLSGPAENGSVDVKEAPVKVRPKVRSRHIEKPAVLPKFGSWDTKNPSSGEAYTLIFKRLRDEKKSGAVPVCSSPTHPKAAAVEEEEEEEEEAVESLESKAKEPLFPNYRAKKDFSRRKAKTTSHQEARQHRKRWILCCKASVLDD